MNHFPIPIFTTHDGADEQDRDEAEQDGLQRAKRGTSPMKVLIVDPDRTAATLLQGDLILRGFDVEKVIRAEEGVVAARRFQPNIVIIDLGIPQGKGLEIATRLRATVFWDTPMIALSNVPAVLRAAFLYGLFDAYFGKPLNIDELIGRIEALTRR